MTLIFSEFFGFNPWFVHFAWVFISLFPFRKKKCCEKISTFIDPIRTKSPFPFDGPQISSSTRTIRVAWENTTCFFWKNKSSKNSRDPAIVGRTPSHLYTIPIPFPFSNPLVRMGNSMGRLPERGSDYWESLESPLKKAPNQYLDRAQHPPEAPPTDFRNSEANKLLVENDLGVCWNILRLRELPEVYDIYISGSCCSK